MINKKNSFAKNDNFETQPFEKYKYTNFLLIFKVIKHQIANPVKIPDFHRKSKMTFHFWLKNMNVKQKGKVQKIFPMNSQKFHRNFQKIHRNSQKIRRKANLNHF